MNKISGLGRGLGSLIPNKKDRSVAEDNEVADLTGSQEKILALPVDKISANPHQPRSNFSEESLAELMASIKEHGIIQPLIATRTGDGWQLIAGERRWRAAKLLNLATVPAIVRDLSEQKKMEIALIENLHRKDLNALEVAAAYRKLIDEFNLTQEELGRRVGKSRPAIANTLRILTVADEVKAAIISGKISEAHARVLAGLPKEDQLALLKRIVDNIFSVRETEQAGRNIVIQKHIRKLTIDPELEAKKERLQQALGTKVEIKKFGGAGQIIIRFFSDEELNEIFKKIVGGSL